MVGKMKEIKINENWTFEDTVNHIKTLKFQYHEVLASFSYFDLKKEVEFKKNVKKSIYNLKFVEWQKDLLWEYMNDDIEIDVLFNVLIRQKQRKMI